MTPMDRTQALLEGGMVERLHCTPHHRPYTVAQHSWGMAMMLLALYPGTPPQGLLLACLTHDIAERWTGDIPATVKWDIAPDLCLPLAKAEHHINKVLNIEYDLPPEQQCWLRALDIAELWHYCLHEQMMGNVLVGVIADRCLQVLKENTVTPPEVLRWATDHSTVHPVRTDDTFGMVNGAKAK